ncbi:unnamed protein product [Durusdinium trenchii]|uniref:Ubiquitin-like domain-containing protein n=2 Tax=Durusdinium trenchii TaxID=1381693 RepID=A0ABP0LTR0_9DINO
MQITIRSLNGESAELDVEPNTTILGLRRFVEEALKIPAAEQRLIYAGTQLEERVTPAWRQRRSSGALSAALGLASLPDGAELTLEHYGIQKGSVLNVVRKVSVPSSACGEELPEGTSCAQDERQRPSLAQLEELNDLELLVLLRPLLRQRPTLRAALLAEAPGGEGRLAPKPPAAPAAHAEPPWWPGERCLVWSNSAQRWCSGSVLAVASEATEKIPSGSVEVSFELGRKWIAPADLAKALRR